MTDAATDLRLEVQRTLPYPPEKVFDAWLDPKMLAKFMTPMEGATVPEVETDAREGGSYRIVMQTPDGTQIPHHGTYSKVDRPRTLVFTWVSPFSEDGSEVTLDFAPDGDGTAVTLTHVKFPSEESRDNHERGWALILESLSRALAT